MPHYKKAFDIGTYTGNGGQYRVGIPTLRGVGPTGTQVAQSLRFRASNSNYLTRTPASSGNRKTWTYSCWFKKTANGGNVGLFSVYGSSSDTNAGGVVFGSSDQIYFMAWSTIWRRTTVAFKDPSRWYHLVIAFDTTQATAANRVKMYIDGKLIDSFAASSDPALNTDYGFNTNNHHEFGAWIPTATSGYSYLDMYLAETYFLDGYAYDASYFGEYNSDGIWVPKAYTGSYGTNGFNLKFASGAVGTDSSGNSNTWTPSGFNVTTSNTTYDIVTDSPTDYLSGSMTTANNAGNYCTLNPLNNSTTTNAPTPTNGNLNYVTPSGVNTSGWPFALGTMTINSGSDKWYFEVDVSGLETDSALSFGWIQTSVVNDSDNSDQLSKIIGALIRNDSVSVGLQSAVLGTYTSRDGADATDATYQIAIDNTTGKIWIGKNNTWYASGNPSAGTNELGTFTPQTLIPFIMVQKGNTNGDSSSALNFGQRPFAYTPPTNFKSVNTYNYPRPADSALWFYGDTPDLMWIKNRSASAAHCVQDTNRGISLTNFTTDTSAENGYPYIMEMNKFGMSLQGGSGVNGSGNSHVYWTWKAGSNTSSTSVTNTDGTITSQVSANRQAGFSIVSYTGTGSITSFGHGLGVKPSFILIKNLTSGSTYWTVWHNSLSVDTYGLYFNTTNAEFAASSYFWPSAPTSTIINIATDGYVNTSGSRYVCYTWAAVPGYSSFGSYVGSGGANGPYVYTGFRPKFVITKGKSIAYSWKIFDSARNPSNPVTLAMWTDLTNADGSGTSYCDFYSNGFKMRDTDVVTNNSGSTYVYMAFAEAPFKYARAR